MAKNTELKAGERWELKDAMFSIEHMKNKVETFAEEQGLEGTKKALNQMIKAHDGQYRKGSGHVPYIIHPLIMACHAFALGIGTDDLISACLLHDVVEDCGVLVEELDANDVVKEAVALLSFRTVEGKTKEESKAEYFAKISENSLASMVKIIDRCNNVSTMATAFSDEKMASYIDETEKYVLPLIKYVKHSNDQYYNAAFLLKYQLLSVMETQKRML